MKTLGVILAALVLVPFLGTAAPSNDSNPLVLQELARYNARTGQSLTIDDLTVLAEQPFTLPLGAIGVQAGMDYATGVLSVIPITAMPDATGPTDSACLLLPGSSSGSTVVLPPFLTCAGPPNPGNVLTSDLICVNNLFCSVTVSGSGFLQLYCQFNTVTSATRNWQTGVGSSTGTGVCSVFAFIFVPPANWASYFGTVSQSPPSGLTFGRVNF